jgi:hypothetical protein
MFEECHANENAYFYGPRGLLLWTNIVLNFVFCDVNPFYCYFQNFVFW